MKISTILSKLETIAQRDERISLNVELKTDYLGKLAPWGCSYHFEREAWVAGWTFPFGHISDSQWRSFFAQLDESVVAFLEKHP